LLTARSKGGERIHDARGKKERPEVNSASAGRTVSSLDPSQKIQDLIPEKKEKKKGQTAECKEEGGFGEAGEKRGRALHAYRGDSLAQRRRKKEKGGGVGRGGGCGVRPQREETTSLSKQKQEKSVARHEKRGEEKLAESPVAQKALVLVKREAYTRKIIHSLSQIKGRNRPPPGRSLN